MFENIWNVNLSNELPDISFNSFTLWHFFEKLWFKHKNINSGFFYQLLADLLFDEIQMISYLLSDLIKYYMIILLLVNLILIPCDRLPKLPIFKYICEVKKLLIKTTKCFYSRLPNKRTGRLLEMKRNPTYAIFPFFHLKNFKHVPTYTFIWNYTSFWKSRVSKGNFNEILK